MTISRSSIVNNQLNEPRASWYAISRLSLTRLCCFSLGVVVANVPGADVLCRVEEAQLNQRGDHVDDGGDLHAVHHERADVLVLVDGPQSVKHPNHEDHRDAIFLSLLSATPTNDIEYCVPSVIVVPLRPHLCQALHVEALVVTTPQNTTP